LVAVFWIEFACENNAFLAGKPVAAPLFWSPFIGISRNTPSDGASVGLTEIEI
jgi:DNA mismatch repair protein MutH